MARGTGDVVWLRREPGLVGLRGREGSNPGEVWDARADAEGEHAGVVCEDAGIPALDVPVS